MSDVKTRRRAYRYRVVETGGEGAKAMADKPHILDWKFFGREYTWNIFGPKDGKPFEHLGFIHGEFMDKGYVEDGQYKPDDS